MDLNELDLNELYFDPEFPGAFGGVNKFYLEVKKNYPNVTRKDIKDFLSEQDAYTLHKDVRKPHSYRRVIVKGIGELYQIDLLDVQKYSLENDGFRYLCFVIDTFSKFLWVFELKNKTGLALKKALQMFLILNPPKLLHADKGTEFFNKHFKRMLEAFGIKLYHTFSDTKASIVERVQRTIRGKLERIFTKNSNHRWRDVVQQVVKNYNNSYHRSIEMKPALVKYKHTPKILQALYPKRKVNRAIFKPGDTVRILMERRRFQKGYEQSWSRELFIVDKRERTKPITYIIKDNQGEKIIGTFYSAELQKVK